MGVCTSIQASASNSELFRWLAADPIDNTAPAASNQPASDVPKGRPEGLPIEDYVIEDHADHVLGTFKTQEEAIRWAKKEGHSPLVARVRHLNDKKIPDHWRAA